MSGTVPVPTVLSLGLQLLLGLAAPLALLLFLQRRRACSLRAFWVGAAVMLLFGRVLIQLGFAALFGSAFGRRLLADPWAYALSAGLMTAVWEETGRLFAFRTVLQRDWGRDANALMYGAGHGGLDAAITLALGSVGTLQLVFLINTGQTAWFEGPREVYYSLLTATPAWQFLLGAADRLLALTIQLSLSVLVWCAATRRGRMLLFPLAILLHAAAAVPPAFLPMLGYSTLPVTGSLLLLALLGALAAALVWQENAMGHPGAGVSQT